MEAELKRRNAAAENKTKMFTRVLKPDLNPRVSVISPSKFSVLGKQLLFLWVFPIHEVQLCGVRGPSGSPHSRDNPALCWILQSLSYATQYL